MKDKNSKTTTIKQTFSYGKSKTVTVEVVEKRKRSKEKNVLNKKVENTLRQDIICLQKLIFRNFTLIVKMI